jgi:hypothetical protein
MAELAGLEVYFVEYYDSYRSGYNETIGGDGVIGYSHTPETRARIGAASKGNQHTKGRKLSEEHKAKISAAGRGREVSEEHRAKLRASATGRKVSEETKAKLRGNQNAKGWKQTDEDKAKKSAALRGRKKSEEHKAALRAAWVRRRPGRSKPAAS